MAVKYFCDNCGDESPFLRFVEIWVHVQNKSRSNHEKYTQNIKLCSGCIALIEEEMKIQNLKTGNCVYKCFFRLIKIFKNFVKE